MAGLLSKVPGFSQQEKGEEPKEDEQSLTTILATHGDRTNFLLLVAGCTEVMRKAVEDTFVPTDVESLLAAGKMPSSSTDAEDEAREGEDVSDSDTLVLHHGDDADAAQDDGARAKAAIAEADAADKHAKEEANAAKAAADAKEAAKKEHLRLVKEIRSKDMQDLKAAALSHFDEWNSRLLARVGEAVNQRDEVESDRKAASNEISKRKPVSTTGTGTKKPTPIHDETNQALRTLYPPLQTPFISLDEPKRVLILHSLLLLTLSLEHYSSQSRILLLHIVSSLRLPVSYLTQDESKVAQGLLEAAKAQMNADEETKRKAQENASRRRWKVGLGAVAGAALIGVTGGLAAPFLAAGIGTVMGGIGLGATATATYLGALAGSAPLVGALFGAYGGRMAGQIVDNYAKEVSDFAFIPVRKPGLQPHIPHGQSKPAEPSSADRRLRVAIGISGWLTNSDDVVKPWRVIGSTGVEAFALRWELEALLSLGSAITTYVKSAAWGVAKHQIIQHTVFAALSAGLWPLGIINVAQVVDNPFSVARSRSEKAGRVLADALINKVQGERPVTLIGYSLGARVIFSCCEELAKRRAFGLVESVVLAGAAVPGDTVNWRRIRSVVAGRVVNVYSTQDYLLGFLYRTSSLQYGIAGLQPVKGVTGVENVDVSGTVEGHTQYRFLTGKVLETIGFEDIDDDAVKEEEKRLQKEEQKISQEQKRKQEQEGEGEKDDQSQIRDMQEEVEKNKKEAGMMGWMNEKMGVMGLGKTSEASNNGGGKQPEASMSEKEKLEKSNASSI